MLTTFFGFWDYWELRHKVTFDGVNKLIWINDGETNLDVQRDLYSAWKEWVLREDNAKYEQAFQVVGGEPTVEGEFLDSTFFLLNGWRLKPYQGVYTLNLVGNLFDVDGGDIKVPAEVDPENPNNITLNLNTSVIVRRVTTEGGTSTTGEGLTQEESDALFNIENKVLAIENRFNTPIEATIEPDQFQHIEQMKAMLTDLWKLHGLDPATIVSIYEDGRVAGDVSQTFTKLANNTLEVKRD